MFTFLAINGVELTADADATWTFMVRLYETGAFHFENLEAWLRLHTQAMEGER
jgi:death-on-curing protein